MTFAVPPSRFCQIAFVVCVALQAVACVPDRGTTPARTWRPEQPEATCEPQELLDPQGSRWSRAGTGALAAKVDRSEAVVVSAVGCNVDVLDRCRSSARYHEVNGGYELGAATVSAKTLEGECAGATHVVRSVSMKRNGEHATPKHVELAPLSLDDFRLPACGRASCGSRTDRTRSTT